MIPTLIGLAVSWYFGFTPIFVIGATLSFFFPRLFRFLFWLLTLPFLVTLGATLLTLLAWGYDIAPMSSETFHTSILIAIIPAFLTTNYLAGDIR